MKQIRNKVFVYGSLRKGHQNNRLLAGSVLLGVGAVTKAARFSMHSLGSYPAVLEGGVYRIRGDVYSVDDATLTELDLLEANGLVYQRQPIGIENHGKCWMYLYLQRGRFPVDAHNPVLAGGVVEWILPRVYQTA